MVLVITMLLCVPQDDLEELKKRMTAMEEELKKLREQKAPSQEELDKLKKKVKSLENDLEVAQEELKTLKEKGVGQDRPEILGILNPAITAFINGAMRVDSETVAAEDGSEVDDKFFLRSAELELRASVDPYVDAVMIVKFVEEHSGEGAVELEEAYGVIKRIPILEEAPLGMRIKAGRYLAPVGQVNRTHQHDLPWTTYPLPIVEYLGTESGLGFFDAGFLCQGAGIMVRPPFFENAALDVELHFTNAGRTRVTEEGDGHTPGYLPRVGTFFKLGDEHSLSANASAYFEADAGNFLVFDATYVWKPVGEFRSLVVGGELFLVHGDDADPLGFFLYAQYQIDWHWYAGVRFDQIEALADEEIRTSLFAAYVTYYTSEYFRIRLGYEFRNNEEEDDNHTVMLELNLVFGSHPPEPWWVNR